MTSIPPALIEAAKIDGAGEIKTFYKIVLPLSVPIMATIGLFEAILYWNELVGKMQLEDTLLILYKSMKQCLTLDKLNTVFFAFVGCTSSSQNPRINSIGCYTFFA
ncbi:ABC transporter permease subunit [Paenibacillus aceris]|uniref:ABC transporter permease subunit n=1 Tax=Paenibacillus aceris TaxID=869555 RepID=UPI0031455621